MARCCSNSDTLALRTTEAGTAQMNDVRCVASSANHGHPGRTGESRRALIYGLDECLVAHGLDHYLKQPIVAALTRDAPAHTRRMQYRKVAMRAVTELDHSERWRDAIGCPSCLAEATHYLPVEHATVWKRGLQARLRVDKEP